MTEILDLTSEVVLNLNLNIFTNDWVQSVWDCDFVDLPQTPHTIENALIDAVTIRHGLSQLHDLLKRWADGRESSEGFWSSLSDNDISAKQIVVLLYHVIVRGKLKSSKADERLNASIASADYLLLLRIPGSRAFQVFSVCVFDKAIGMLNDLAALKTVPDAPKKKRGKGAQPKQSKRRKVQIEADFSDDDIEMDEDEHEVVLQPDDLADLHRSCIGLLKDFVSLVKSNLLDEQCFEKSLEALVRFTTIEPNSFNGKFDVNIEIDQMDNFPQLGFAGLQFICINGGNEKPDQLANVCKHLKPNILMMIGNSAPQTIPASMQTIKDYTVSFVCFILRQHLNGFEAVVRILLQHLCVGVPDKTDFRAKVSQAVVIILREFSTPQYASFIQWIIKYSKSAKISYRTFALDLMTLLLEENERITTDADIVSVPVDMLQYLSRQHLMKVLVERCSDISPSVRTRAITAFLQCITSKDPWLIDTVRSIVTPRTSTRPTMTRLVKTPVPVQQVIPPLSESEANADAGEQDMVQGENESNVIVCAGGLELTAASFDISLPDSSGVVSMLRRRCNDSKIYVRKAAILAVANIVQLEGKEFCQENIDLVREHCRDKAVSVRKQSMQSLTELLMQLPDSQRIQKCWLAGVLPMVLDGETSIQTKCFELLEEVFLRNIVTRAKSEGEMHRMVWSLLSIITATENGDLRRYFRKACVQWGKAGTIPKNFALMTRTHIGTENNMSAWYILSELAGFIKNFDSEFLLQYWNSHAKNVLDKEHELIVLILRVLERIASNVGADDAQVILSDLKNIVGKFSSPPEITTAMINAISKLSNCNADLKLETRQWFGEVLGLCDHYLSQVILNENQDTVFDEESIVRHLYTIGELTQICPEKTPKRIYILVQSLVAAPMLTADAPEMAGSQLSQGSSQAGVVLSQFRGSKMSTRIRAFAFITLGKLCLQSEEFAKKCVPALARELEISPDTEIRNNVVMILCDLIIRYTLLVDRYITCVSTCLRDKATLIRRQTLILLTRLLQEDFIKWKGSLFFRFVHSVVDEEARVRDFAIFTLTNVLQRRNQNLYFHHFVESIFYFNAYTKHPTYNNFGEDSGREKLFSLAGEGCAEKRIQVYKFLLENMNDFHRFKVMEKLVQEILLSFVDEVLPLDDESSAVLRDALLCLASKEIKLSALKSSKQDDEFVENEEELAVAVQNVAAKQFMTQIMKKTVVESIVPIMVSLKHLLEKHRSPVLKDFMRYLRVLMKDYKNEVKAVLATDKQLENELEFDLRRFENDEDGWYRQPEADPKTPVVVNQSRRSSAPHTPTSVRTPSSRSPAPGGSNSPIPAILAPPALHSTNPNRRISLATIAVINSARKAVEKASRLSEARKMPCADTSMDAKETETDDDAAEVRPRDSSFSEQSPKVGFQSPKIRNKNGNKKGQPKNLLRAISTPAAHLGDFNVTFAQGDVSMIAPTEGTKRSNSRFRGGQLDSNNETDEMEVEVADVRSNKRKQKSKFKVDAAPVARLARLDLSSDAIESEKSKDGRRDSQRILRSRNSLTTEQDGRH